MTKTNDTLDGRLAQMHEALIDALIARVSSDEAVAADFNVVRQFLRDNGINAIPRKGSPLDKLAKSLPPMEDDDAGQD